MFGNRSMFGMLSRRNHNQRKHQENIMSDQPNLPQTYRTIASAEDDLTEDSIRKLAQLAQDEMEERHFSEVSKQWDIHPILQENWETDNFLGYDRD